MIFASGFLLFCSISLFPLFILSSPPPPPTESPQIHSTANDRHLESEPSGFYRIIPSSRENEAFSLIGIKPFKSGADIPRNEDAYNNVNLIPKNINHHLNPSVIFPLAAVYDGHAGHQVSYFLAETYPKYLASLLPALSPNSETLSSDEITQIEHAIMRSVMDLDSDICTGQGGSINGLDFKDAGSTFAMAFQMKNFIFMVNLGDSRVCVSSTADDIVESKDHTASDETEIERVRAAGGIVFRFKGAYRVNGQIVPSRAFGDCSFKRRSRMSRDLDDESPVVEDAYSPDGWISASPSIKRVEMTKNVDYRVTVATDGLWDTLTGEAVYEIWDRILLKTEDETVAGDLRIASIMASIARRRKSVDDITVIAKIFSYV